MVLLQSSVAVSLCVLGLSLSLVSGQFPADRLAPRGSAAGIDFTNRIVSFDEFTSGAQSYHCFIGPGGNNWFDPAGDPLFISFNNPANRVGPNPGPNQIFLEGFGGSPTEAQGIFLNRGATYYALDGDWCCGSNDRALSSQDRCVTFTPCPTLPVLTNGMIQYDRGTNVATYTCDAGFIIMSTSSNTITRTCSGTDTTAGSWSGSDPSCLFVQCPTLDNPPFGTVSISPTNRGFNAVATYSCNSGYTLSSIDPVTCMSDSQWSPQPTCNPVDCGTLSNPANGVVDTPDGTTFMMTATYTCNLGFVVSGTTSRTIMGTCQSNGVWSVGAPVCNVLCPREEFSANGVVTYSTNDAIILPGQTAMYMCNIGYNLDPPTITMRTCIEGTGWTFSLPTCNIVNCGPLGNPANGVAMQTGGTTFNQMTTYTCNNGYLINGASSRTCMDNGQWNPEAPVCDFIAFSSDSNNLETTNPQAELSILISNIGEGQAALTCFSDVTGCCTTTGQWTGPDGDVPNTVDGDGFYVSRSVGPPGSISLNQRGNSSEAGGLYCCSVPRLNGVNGTTCVTVTVILPPPANNQAGAIAGGVIVALIFVLALIVTLIIVVVLVRRMKANRLKYAPVLKASGSESLPPSRPAPYSTRYVKAKGAEEIPVTPIVARKIEPSILEFPIETYATEGEEVYLKVKVGGVPPPTLTWYHNGAKVTPDYATELDDDGGITFPSVEAKHAGTYRLVVSGDSEGTIEKTVEVFISEEGAEQKVSTGNVNLGPVTVDQLGGYVSELHANGNTKFKENYKALDSGEKGHEVTVAKIPENKLCNRFGNIAPYDDNRIELQPIPGREDCQSDYVNASYVDGYNVPKKFIATQGPIPRTVVAFWRLMWQERPPTIVMVTNLKEGNKIKCQPYWPESGKKTFGPFTVMITDQQVLADYTIRTLKVTVEGERKVLKTTQFHFTTWPDHGVPDYATPILAFHRRIKSQHNPSKGPLLVHCSAGVGRTGTFIVIDNVLDQIAAEGVVDISGTIVRARNQRMKLVQTQDQYVFIHDAILESVTCGDTQINAGDLRTQIQKMARPAPGSKTSQSGYEYQFEVLRQVTPNPDEVNCTIALKNSTSNRGKKYLPGDNNRVILKGENPDYINAVFAHGYKHQKAFIIAQNPLDSTVRNFWKVIYDRKCAVVVMLTPLTENGKEACSQYWPQSGSVSSFGEFTIDNLGEESFPGFTIRQLSVLSEKTQKAHQVTQFHVQNWKSNGECANLKTVTDVNEEVTKVQRRTGNRSIVVHCSDTATRSGMYCSIATIIDRCKTEGVVDVFQVVKALRIHKPGAVPSLVNYQAIFDAALVYLDSFDTYANFQNI